MPRTTTERGYGADHRAERKRWAPIVERGEVDCHAVICLHASRRIQPGQPWHLGHTPDRSAWTGPEHERCNTTEGAKRGNAQRRAQAKRPDRPSLWWNPLGGPPGGGSEVWRPRPDDRPVV
jgi:hypothetical protein